MPSGKICGCLSVEPMPSHLTATEVLRLRPRRTRGNRLEKIDDLDTDHSLNADRIPAHELLAQLEQIIVLLYGHRFTDADW